MLEIIKELITTVGQFLTSVLLSAFPLVNALLIIVAGCLGAMLYGHIKPAYRDIMTRTLGLAVLLLGISELWDCFFVWEDGQVEITGTFLVLISLLVGGLLGYALDLDRAFGKLGILMHRLFESDSGVKDPKTGKLKKEELPPELLAAEALKLSDRAEGFTMATMICGFSSLVLTNFLLGRMTDDAVPLLIKMGIDFVVIFFLAFIYGSGVPFAGATVLVSEGLLGIIYSLWGDLLTPEIVDQIALIGAVILVACGIQLATGKKLRPANLIPAFFIPGLYTIIMEKVETAVEEKVKK